MSDLTLLPLSPEEFQRARVRVLQLMEADGVAQDECGIQLEADFRKWLDEVQYPLPKSVSIMLKDAAWHKELKDLSIKPAETLYKNLVDKLASHRSVNRKSAAISLSYLPLIVRLAKEFRLSSAGIAEVLNKSDRRVILHWKSIDKILNLLRLKQELSSIKVKQLLKNDRTEMERVFRDADIPAIVEILSYEADGFALGTGFTGALDNILTRNTNNVVISYLQTLYYLCVVTEYFDHPLEYLYTFKPRGSVANMIFDIFPSDMAPTGNPILNNFKAIDRLTHDWARSRDDYPLQASALVEVVLGLSSLSYSSRRHLARSIRGALLRFIEINCPQRIKLPPARCMKTVKSFLSAVAKFETNTRGILEQRVCDFVASIAYSSNDWRPRGLCDPVNATNSASKKLGDSDFQNAPMKTCVAIEAHAGRLTPIYIEEHLRTLRRNLPARLKEWERIADLSEWRLEILFVVHEDASSAKQLSLPNEITCELTVITFDSWISKVIAESALSESETIAYFNRYVVDILMARNTPHDVREKAEKILAELVE